MMTMRTISALVAALLCAGPALAQSQFPAHTTWGNPTASQALPKAMSQAELTTLCNSFTTSLLGCVGASGGGTTNFLRADGTWATPITSNVFSNPSASLGLSAVNGSALTAMRSDAAPALSQAIIPVWTGIHTFNNDALFADGRPWCDVRAMGAKGDGSTDDSAAFQACSTAMTALGSGDIFVPPPNTGSKYCVKANVTIGGSVRLLGSNAVSISSCQTDVTMFTFSGNFCGMANIFLFGKGTQNDTGSFSATQPVLAWGCGNSFIMNSRIAGGTGTLINNADVRIYGDTFFTQSYGTALVLLQTSTAGVRFTDAKLDQSWPQGFPTGPITIPARITTHAYATPIQTVVSATAQDGHSYLLQLKTAGTTSGSATVTMSNYGIDITDGTAVWRLVSAATYYALQADTGATEVTIIHGDFTGPFTSSIATTNSLAGTAPTFIRIADSTMSTTSSHLIDMQAGSDLTITGSNIFGCLLSGCNGINVAANLNNVLSGNNDFKLLQNAAVAVAAGTSDFIYALPSINNGFAVSNLGTGTHTSGFTGTLTWSTTAPVPTGFCTTPTIPVDNGTAAFTINVGTACGGSTGTLTLPTAATGWVCDFHNVTAPASNVVEQTGGTTTTVTLTNYARTTGLAANFTSSDVIRAKCVGY